MRLVRVTGLETVDDGGVVRIEVEVKGGSGRIRFAQAHGPVPNTQVGALVVDDTPVALAIEGAVAGILALPGPASDEKLPAVPAGEAAVDEARVLGLSALWLECVDGLYTVAVSRGGALPSLAPGFHAPADALVDVAPAADAGAPVYASLGAHGVALLAGRAAAQRGVAAYVVRADVVVDAPGFVARMHDRGAREAFARSPTSMLDDAALRDAVANLHALHPGAALGPFTEDRVEPAAQQARALVWDLRAEDGVDDASDPRRESKGAATEFVSRVKVKSVAFDVAFVTRDGRHIGEVIVRTHNRFRATGLRPAARGIARTLRQLADEGA